MPRLVTMNDPHYTTTEPECRAPSYGHEVLDKFHAVAKIARTVKAKAIGCTGDWFHRKGRVSYSETNDLLAILAGWRAQGLDAIGILGNHDIAGHALDSLDTRAVGAFVHSKSLHLLDHTPYRIEGDDGAIHVTGTSYFHGCDDNDENRIKMYGAEPPDDDAVHVHLCHGTLLQSGEFPEAFTTAETLVGILDAAGRLPDVIICGHLHFNEHVRTYAAASRSAHGNAGRKVAVARVGSLSRVSADDLTRQPVALVTATQGRRYSIKEVPVGRAAVLAAPQGPEGDPKNPGEHDARIKEFVRVLREEADEYSLSDFRALVERVTKDMGHDPEIAQMALEAIEKRQ